MSATFDPNSLPSCAAAAEAGVVDAQYCLGMHYANGRDVERDYISAHKWFNLAAMRGSAPARDVRGELAVEMSADQVAEAQRLAREWVHAH